MQAIDHADPERRDETVTVHVSIDGQAFIQGVRGKIDDAVKVAVNESMAVIRSHWASCQSLAAEVGPSDEHLKEDPADAAFRRIQAADATRRLVNPVPAVRPHQCDGCRRADAAKSNGDGRWLCVKCFSGLPDDIAGKVRMNAPRNAPCPCNSGRKAKSCCRRKYA